MSKVFPKRFLWGAQTSAHQVEGGLHNQWTPWELENAKSLAAQARFKNSDLPGWEADHPSTQATNYISGKVGDHYSRFEEDFDLLQKIGLTSYRFSIEWSRLEPEENAWDAAAVSYYKRYFAALKRRGIEPVVTLLDSTLPVWFAKKGGFAKRANVDAFVRYGERVVQELCRDVRYIITINEPEVYAVNSYYRGIWPPEQRSAWQTWRVLSNQLRAHVRLAKRIHQLSRSHKVSIAKQSHYFYPGDDAWLSRLSAHCMQYVQDDYVLGRLRRHCDFIGVNYTRSQRVYGYRVHNPEQRRCDLGWELTPGDLQFVVERLYRRYKKPLLVTENGLADADDDYRKWWLASTVAALQRALQEDIPVEGYFYKSLLDGFCWEEGRWPRFGLVALDYTTGERTLRPSARWFAVMLKKLKGDA